MIRNLMHFVMLASLVCSSGCASIVSHGTKTLPIMTQPDEATCEIIDTDGNAIVKAKTPYTAPLERSSGYFQKASYKIKLSKEGYTPEEVEISAGINGWYFGNILFGGLIGLLIVDPATGAMWKIYEDNVLVKLYPDSPEGRLSMATDKYNGRNALKNRDYDVAIEETTKGIAISPTYLDGYRTRSEAYCKMGEFEKSIIDVNKAIELRPDFWMLYKERADVYFAMKEYDKALSDTNKAIEIKPDYADAYFCRAQVYQKLNDIPKAKADMNQAAVLGNTSARNFQF